MSSRITRSAARLASDSTATTNSTEPSHPPTRATTSTKKRKASGRTSDPAGQGADELPPRTSPRPKRQKINVTTPSQTTASAPTSRSSRRKSNITDTAMSGNGYWGTSQEESTKANICRSSSKYTEEPLKPTVSKSKERRAASKNNKKSTDVSPPTRTTARKPRRRPLKTDAEPTKVDEDPASKAQQEPTTPPPPPSDSNDDTSPNAMEDERQDPFSAALFGSGRGPPSGLSSTLRALSGMMSGMSSRLREILNNMRQIDNPSMQLVALEELSNLLLVSNEDNLSGQFSPDPYVKELVSLMQPNPITGEENPEMMLLACRCISNLMEALRGSVANVVYGGAVPVLCQKLQDIQYIDVAEQALSTLSKISVDFPGSIVREGGLTACLQFLDFFATSTQRTAVITAANCCRNIPHDSFPIVRDVMPILQNVLGSHDQKVVEQGCLCVIRVIDSFKRSSDKLEQLIEPQLLKTVLSLLLPGTTNLIGANIHTDFLRVLAIVAKASPKLSVEMLKMDIVDTLYQILTGVSPPTETADAASKIDSVVIMQALIHRPREQVYEALNVICELLPHAKSEHQIDIGFYEDFDDISGGSDDGDAKPTKDEKRRELLQECQSQTRRFAVILLPTLTDAYSSTVNLSVRQKVLTAQLKILSNLETTVIEDALRPVPYASFLASILSQEDHPSLVMFALQASELLFDRLENIYQYQFYREGVIGEIKKLADRPLDSKLGSFSSVATHDPTPETQHGRKAFTRRFAKISTQDRHKDGDDNTADDNGDVVMDEGENDDDEDDEENNEDDEAVGHGDEIIVGDGDDDEDSDSSESSEGISSPFAAAGIKDLVTIRAKDFLERSDTSKVEDLRAKATAIREDLQRLSQAIVQCYSQGTNNGKELFQQLGEYFDGDALQSITSSELLDSGVIKLLGEVLNPNFAVASGDPRSDFLAVFTDNVNEGKIKAANTATTTALSVLAQKLQDLLSRAEHFEVLTVNSNASETSRSSATSMLSRQIRLKLTAEPAEDIPPTYRELIVSIHAIATFKALDEYLRPRISLSERPPSGSRRRNMLEQLANARMAQLSGAAEAGLLNALRADTSTSPPTVDTSHDNRPSSRSSRSKPPSQERAATQELLAPEKAERRRSSRRTQTSEIAPQALLPPEPSTEETGQNLECADEKQIAEDGLPSEMGDTALEAVVHGLDDDSDEDAPEPAAVNMEIASTGRVTARKEDGTRVFTPLQPGTPVPGSQRHGSSEHSPSSTQDSTGLPSATSRPSSYAAALASIPQDWHIEFTIEGKPIPGDSTIYRAVHHNRDQSQVSSSRPVWSNIHTIHFKKVKGPPPNTSIADNLNVVKDNTENNLPASLNDHPVTASILTLLRILYEMNGSINNLRQALVRSGVVLHAEPLSSFINTKLTAKMNRQLEEPLIVASNCLPDWSEDLARTFPFLFPFETRHLFLQSTSFGYSRSMARWTASQNESDDRRDRRRDDRPLMGRPQRQKVRISRQRILESAMKVMEMYGASPSVLEVEFFDEVGTGLGPTLEFYSTVSKEFSKKKLKLWRENDSVDNREHAFGNNGLFPAPMSEKSARSESGKKLLHCFRMLGKFVARSMLDSRIIDVAFNPTFFRVAHHPTTSPSIALLRSVDNELANSLSQLQLFANAKINIEQDASLQASEKADRVQNFRIKDATVDDLMLDFTLPGYPAIELMKGGSDVSVSMDNVGDYVARVLDMTLGSGVRPQIEAFQNGFSQVFSYASLKAFTPNELVMLFGQVEEDWSMETLTDSIKADHGFNMDSKSVKNLLQTMSELTNEQRRNFLQFITGSPKLPIGGFKSLTPMFTVVCKPSEPPYTSDDYLPSVMTCVNYLKLPDYSSQQVLKQRLDVAIREGQGAFHLS